MRYIAVYDESLDKDRWIVVDTGRGAVTHAYSYGDDKDESRALATAATMEAQHEYRLAMVTKGEL